MSQLQIGYTLSSEEHGPQQLIESAVRAEEVGFSFLSISDHYFPWVDSQGQSPFVWSIIGAIAQATKSVPLMTGVTCPIMRIHPVILAQAAATTAAMLEDRFWFGVGTGENLNEHVVGLGWPNIEIRLDMLAEALDIIRDLWTGKLINRRGEFFLVDQARIYTMPEHVPPIYMAASGTASATMAGQIADGLITTSNDQQTLQAFDEAGGQHRPRLAQVHVCVDDDVERAKQTALEFWPNTAIRGQASQELPMPLHFSQLSQSITPDQIGELVVCGDDVDAHTGQIQEFADAGFSHIYIHQIGPNQEAFFRFYQQEILPKFQ